MYNRRYGVVARVAGRVRVDAQEGGEGHGEPRLLAGLAHGPQPRPVSPASTNPPGDGPPRGGVLPPHEDDAVSHLDDHIRVGGEFLDGMGSPAARSRPRRRFYAIFFFIRISWFENSCSRM